MNLIFLAVLWHDQMRRFLLPSKKKQILSFSLLSRHSPPGQFGAYTHTSNSTFNCYVRRWMAMLMMLTPHSTTVTKPSVMYTEVMSQKVNRYSDLLQYLPMAGS
uniref:(northern house mosquito) hypothetical protein n=1 Tax=Culex pipiens TaxID=7175 RepID=A0A8D8B7K3_CULPI